MRFIKLACLLTFWASTALAAPVSFDVNRNVNLALGTRAFGPFVVPDDVSQCRITIDRTKWTNASATITATLDISVGGGPFTLWRSITASGGGTYVDRLGNPITATMISGTLPDGANRQVRGNYVVAGARFISTITVACS